MAEKNNNNNPDINQILKAKQEITKLREEFNKFARAEAENNVSALDYARTLNTELRDSLGVRQRLNDQEKTLRNLGNEVVKAVQQNVVELGNAGKINREILKARSLENKLITEIKSIAGDLNDQQAKYAQELANTYSSHQKINTELEDAKKAHKDQEELVESIENRQKSIGVLTKNESERLKNVANTERSRLEQLQRTVEEKEKGLQAADSLIYELQKELKLEGEIDSQTAHRLAALLAMKQAHLNNLSELEEEEQIQRKIQDRVGVTGALVKGTGAFMERLGMRSGIFHQAMEDAQKEMHKLAEESERVDPITGEINRKFSKTEIMLKGLKTLSKGFGKALLDPFSILTKILVVLTAIDKAQTDYTRQTGRQASQLKANNRLSQKQVSQVSTLVDLMKTAGELTRQTGLDVSSIFSPEQIGQISDAEKLLGLSAEQARGLAMQMKLTNKSADEIGNAIYNNVDAGINKKAVYDDILSTSDDIVASAGGNTKALAKAASAAKKLGMDLRKVSAIADGLLNFEDSISAELEAQLLTGKQINLNKAREAALNNDLEGVANELRKNGASAAEFGKMNRIQQEGLAKALGMSREELAKTVLTEKARQGMTAKQIADARGVTLEQSKQMDIQQKMQDSLFKLSEAFVPILDILHPIVSWVGSLLNLINPITPILLGAYGVLKAIQASVKVAAWYQGLKAKYAKQDALTQSNILKTHTLQNAAEKVRLGLKKRGLFLAIREAKVNIAAAAMGALKAAVSGIGRLLGPLAIPIGLAAAAGVAALGYKLLKGNDVVSPGYGQRTLMGPEGAIALNNKDTVIAGTNLFPKSPQDNTTMSVSPINMEPLVQEIKGLRQEMISLLQTVREGGDVFLDSDKIGRTQAKFFSKTTGS